jgi:hypothetical protein
MHNGMVMHIEAVKKLFIVMIEGKDYALWECKDNADLLVGSLLKGPLYQVGPAILHNVANGMTLHAFGHTGACSVAHCRSVCT